MRITARGVALLITTAILLGVGLWLGLIEMVMLGVIGLTVLFASLLTVAAAASASSSQIQVIRAAPSGLFCGQAGTVTVRVVTGANLSGGQFTDLASIGLVRTGEQTLGQGKHLELSYTVTPKRTGHWQLGPLKWQQGDVFGLWVVTWLLGEPTRLVAWPRTTSLPVTFPASRAAGNASGAAPDDVTLREYQPGDDLRRVHWPTTARKGAPMVRENGGPPKNSVRVLIDPALLQNRKTGEWALEHGASVACSALENAHQVQIVDGSASEFIDCQITGRQQVLNRIAQFAAASNKNPKATVAGQGGAKGAVTYAIVGSNINLKPAVASGRNYALVIGDTSVAANCRTLTRHRLAGSNAGKTWLTPVCLGFGWGGAMIRQRLRFGITTLVVGLAIWAATFALAPIFSGGWRAQSHISIALALTTMLLAGARVILSAVPSRVVRTAIPPVMGLIGAAWFSLTSVASPLLTYNAWPDAASLSRLGGLLAEVSDTFSYGIVPLPSEPPALFAVISLSLLLLVVTDALAHARFGLLAALGPLVFWVPAIGLGFAVPQGPLVASVALILAIITVTNPARRHGTGMRLTWRPVLLGAVAGAVAIAPSIGASYAAVPRFAPQRFFPTHSAESVIGGDFGYTLPLGQSLNPRSAEPLFTYTTSTGQHVGFLRFATYSHFVGQNWAALTPAWGEQYAPTITRVADSAAKTPQGPPIQVDFTIERLTGSTLPLAGNERAIVPPGKWRLDSANNVARIYEPLEPGTEFQMFIPSGSYDVEALRAAFPGIRYQL